MSQSPSTKATTWSRSLRAGSSNESNTRSASPSTTTGPTRKPAYAPAMFVSRPGSLLCAPDAPIRNHGNVSTALVVSIFWLLFSVPEKLPLLADTNHERGPGSIPTSTPTSGVANVKPVSERMNSASSNRRSPNGSMNLPALA